MKDNKAKLLFILSMVIFGTIGIFRKYIPLSSEMLSIARGVIGSIFLFIIMLITKEKFDKQSIKKNLILLIISGSCIGINWLFLFESYKYTSVATATLCYYMAPIFVMIITPFVLKEKLNIINIVAISLALIGMVFVSGIIEVGFNDTNTLKGVIFGLLAACFYASVVLINKKITKVNAYPKTILQLIFASIILIPYAFINSSSDGISFSLDVIILVLIVGIIHTGISYALYFSSMEKISSKSVAIFSFIDPVLAIVLSYVVLKEPMSLLSFFGAILILLASFINELNLNKNNKKLTS